jgi:hypothetical protein
VYQEEMTCQLDPRELVKFARSALFEYLRGEEGSPKVSTAVASRKLKEKKHVVVLKYISVYLLPF